MATEKLRPDADDSAGSWTDEGGATTGLYQSVDEVTADDADYIKSPSHPTAEAVKLRLSDPTGTITAATLNYELGRGDYSQEIDVHVKLMEGTTVIAEWYEAAVPVTPAQYSRTLSSGEIAAITDGSSLFLQFEATGQSGATPYENLLDADGNQVTLDEALVSAKQAELEAAIPMKMLRTERNQRLANTDWWASSDLTMTEAQTAYRQALRDITDTYTSLDDVVWPEVPNE